jgi:hypothetical protein
MLMVPRRMQDGSPDSESPLPPLEAVERPAESTMEGGGTDIGLESRQMPTHPDL